MVRELVDRLDGLQRLPAGGVQVLRSGERLLFVSDNGRYVLTGPAFDLWHGARLGAFDQAMDLARRVDLDHLQLDPAALDTLNLANLTGAGSEYNVTGTRADAAERSTLRADGLDQRQIRQDVGQELWGITLPVLP
jgi:hypothetical protein